MTAGAALRVLVVTGAVAAVAHALDPSVPFVLFAAAILAAEALHAATVAARKRIVRRRART